MRRLEESGGDKGGSHVKIWDFNLKAKGKPLYVVMSVWQDYSGELGIPARWRTRYALSFGATTAEHKLASL